MHVHTAACLHANAKNRVDPTQTKVLRSRYEADMVRRFKAIKKAIRQRLVEEDALQLKTNAGFSFPKSSDKVSSFMNWLKQSERKGLLSTTKGTPVQSSGAAAWQNTYIASAYQKGLASAAKNMKGQGVKVSDRWIQSAFFAPQHADRAGLIYTRAYNGLKGITDAMDSKISRTLAQGILEGRGVMDIASDLDDAVDGIGIVRARMLARTEVISAHAEATLAAYQEAGIEGVTVQGEFTTANDDAVCPDCEDLEGTVMSIDDAQGIIPVHPNCRCAWLPVVDNPDSASLGDVGDVGGDE